MGLGWPSVAVALALWCTTAVSAADPAAWTYADEATWPRGCRTGRKQSPLDFSRVTIAGWGRHSGGTSATSLAPLQFTSSCRYSSSPSAPPSESSASHDPEGGSNHAVGAHIDVVSDGEQYADMVFHHGAGPNAVVQIPPLRRGQPVAAARNPLPPANAHPGARGAPILPCPHTAQV